jgi:hypothetical protein
MELIFVILLVFLTSTFAYQVMKRLRRSSPRSIREALRAFFEWVGAFTLFLAANVALGALIIFVIRWFTPRFVAIYELENLLLPALSAVQAFVFRHAFHAS